MSLRTGLTIIGLSVAAMPYLGFPGYMKDVFYLVVGILIVVTIQVYAIRRDIAKHKQVAAVADEATPEVSALETVEETEEPIKIAHTEYADAHEK